MKCDYFINNVCRSCSLLDQGYDQSLNFKEHKLKTLFIDHRYEFLATQSLDNHVEQSRTKLKLAAFSQGQDIAFGIVDSKGEPTMLDHCPLHVNSLNELLVDIKPLLNKYSIPAYDIKSKRGELKYVIISVEEQKGDILLRFVLRSKESLDRLRKLTQELLKLRPSVKVISANIQPEPMAILEGLEEIVLTEQKYIIHQFDGIKLALGARSFFQVTPQIAQKLYANLTEHLRRDRPQNILDLFCGVGAFAFYAQKICPQVTGVEISKEAIECALISNELNSTNISFKALDVGDFLSQHSSSFEAVIVNPPRRGLGEDIVERLNALSFNFLYYSSCNAETLLRDTQLLSSHYQLKSLQLFDMFPFTEHFETFAVFHRKS